MSFSLEACSALSQHTTIRISKFNPGCLCFQLTSVHLYIDCRFALACPIRRSSDLLLAVPSRRNLLVHAVQTFLLCSWAVAVISKLRADARCEIFGIRLLHRNSTQKVSTYLREACSCVACRDAARQATSTLCRNISVMTFHDGEHLSRSGYSETAVANGSALARLILKNFRTV